MTRAAALGVNSRNSQQSDLQGFGSHTKATNESNACGKITAPMNSSFKASAIPAAGYGYQTMAGFRVLADWLEDPGRYEWVIFEAMEVGAKGLDDIIAKRADGRMELTQVKFTVDAFDDANALTWDWLLSQRGVRGKSLLQKWANAILAVGLPVVAYAGLLTNRRPDAEFASHLAHDQVDYARLGAQLREQIEDQLGGERAARQFFGSFRFEHSYAGFESLERSVFDTLVPQHTDRFGWLNLFRHGHDWAIRKNSPAPDGRITIATLRGVISAKRPRVLNQEFRIPQDYRPPDLEFAEDLVEELKQPGAAIEILWGSPGQGKSTFLSYLCERMREATRPIIRHHYFVELADTGERLSAAAAANSLIWQIQTEFPEVPLVTGTDGEHLRACIAECGEHFATQGKPFIVVIDGLDHVWRENDENTRPLDDLFRHLIPLPPNVKLIVGTQKVDQKRLPSRLVEYANEDSWTPLPLMDLSAVLHWLRAQHRAASFEVRGRDVEDALTDLAKAFVSVSGGHPLVLTYVFERLASHDRVLTPNAVREADSTPPADVNAYYMGMWRRLSGSAKDALHLLAAAPFTWPELGLESCLAISGSVVTPEMGHLLVETEAGLRAFHGSLYVFVRSQPDHTARATTLLPNLVAWLRDEAAPHVRWAWLWIFQNRAGDPTELLQGTDSQWLVSSLAHGHPTDQASRILQEAEDAAFAADDYGLLERKRALKTRLANGPTFQIDDSARLWRSAKLMCGDRGMLLELASTLNTASFEELHLLALLHLGTRDAAAARDVLERMRRRFNNKISAGAFERGEFEPEADLLLEIIAKTDQFDTRRLIRFVRHHEKTEPFRNFLAHYANSGSLERMLEFAGLPMPRRLRGLFEVEAVRMATMAGAALHLWPQFERFRKHPISFCWAFLQAVEPQHRRLPRLRRHELLDRDDDRFHESDLEFADYLHEAFFFCVGAAIGLRGVLPPAAMPRPKARPWLSQAMKKLGVIAETVARVLVRGDAPVFGLVYRLLDLPRPDYRQYDANSDFRAVRRAAVMIAADLFLLCRARSKLDYIPDGEWVSARSSPYFYEEFWREAFFAKGYRLVRPELVAEEIKVAHERLTGEVGMFNEVANELAALAEWATSYGLRDLARTMLASSYRWVIAYGWRKDSQLHFTINMVDQLAQHDANAARALTRRLAPMVDRVDDMTEDSGTYASDLAELVLKLMPSAYPAYYTQLLDKGEWYVAERCFREFAKVADPADPLAGALTAFLWDRSSYSDFKDRPEARPLVEQWDLLTSQGPLRQERDRTTPAPPTGPPGAPAPDVEAYPPEQLDEFLAELNAMRQHEQERNLLGAWVEVWKTNGASARILAVMGARRETLKFGSLESQLLDKCFELSLVLEGPAPAFEWLVLAHIERHGWDSRFYGSKESDARLTAVAKHYQKRWREFLRRTTIPVANRYGAGRVAPGPRLVSFLLELGEVAEAVHLAETLIDITCSEFDVQPLRPPRWLEGAVPEASVLASVAVSRLALPIPAAKHFTTWAFGEALQDAASRAALWPALMHWVCERDFESEIVEALVPLLTTGCTPAQANEIRRHVKRPSIAMDMMLAGATRQKPLVPSWTGCHSGSATQFANLDDTQGRLASGHVLPTIFTSTFEDLEDSSGKPFLRQWAHEYEQLLTQRAVMPNEHFDYFADGEQGASGMVVGRSSHAARSAFLRTLAFAVEYWGMPLDRAYQAATPALPGDPALLSMPPGPPPAFAAQLYGSIGDIDPMGMAANAMRALRTDPAQMLLHFSACLFESPRLTVDLTAFAVPIATGVDAERWVNVHENMRGQVTRGRDKSHRIVIPMVTGKAPAPSRAPYLLAPILLDHLGYFEAELLHRTPYIPAWSPGASLLLAQPERGGMAIKVDGTRVGQMNWWLANWRPFRLSGAPAGTACSTYVDASLAEQYVEALESPLGHACALTVRRREQDYGDWTHKTSSFFAA